MPLSFGMHSRGLQLLLIKLIVYCFGAVLMPQVCLKCIGTLQQRLWVDVVSCWGHEQASSF